MEFASILVVLALIVVLGFTSIKIVKQSTVMVIERLGKFNKRAETGVNFIIPFIDSIRDVIDLREHVVDFPPQPVITKDNVTMQIDTVVYYQITDPIRNTYEIANPISAIENLTATTLRNIIGEMDLDETLTSRDVVNTKLRAILDDATDKWGIRVNRVELKNIIPPKDIQDAMEKQMRAERERREVILRAEGERESAIKRAEGERESAIKRAEGFRQAKILEAEGEAQAILTVQEAKAAGTKMVFTAIKESDPTNEVVSIRALEAMERVADGQATKIVIPSEASAILGALSVGKDMLSGDK